MKTNQNNQTTPSELPGTDTNTQRQLPSQDVPKFQYTLFGEDVYVYMETSLDGAKEIVLRDPEDKFLTVLSVTLPGQAHLLAADEFFVRFNLDNVLLVLEALRSDLFRDTGRRVGNLRIPIWKKLF